MLDKLNASFIPHLSSLIIKVSNFLFTPPSRRHRCPFKESVQVTTDLEGTAAVSGDLGKLPLEEVPVGEQVTHSALID